MEKNIFANMLHPKREGRMEPAMVSEATQYPEIQEKALQKEKQALDMLGKLIEFPSVAIRDAESINQCADHVEKQLRSRGFDAKQFKTAGSPIIFAEKNVGAERTLLLYHHYDVQPEGPLELWESSPWKMTIRDGRIYGRGAQDNKGPYIANLLGISLIEEIRGELPINVKFVIEGEEEASSVHLSEFAKAHEDFLKADGCAIELLTTTPGSPAEVYCGCKGMVYLDVIAGGPPRFPRADVHSGFSNAVPNAAWRLIQALSSLKDENENILVDGIDERVMKPSDDDLKALEEYEADVVGMLKEDYGLDKLLLNLSGVDALEAVFMKPSITVCGITAGFDGPGCKTIVPSTARAKLEIRLVPHLTAENTIELLKKHFSDKGFDDIEIQDIGGSSYDPAKTPVNNPFVRLVHDISREVALPASSSVVPMAFGTGPGYLFTPHAPMCLTISQVDLKGVNIHAPNENWPLKSLTNTIAFVAMVADRMKSM